MVLKNALHKVKANDQHLSFDIIGRPRLGHNISNCWYPKICSNLYFYKRVCVLLVHYTLCMIFQINCCSKLYSINGPNFIVWLPSSDIGQYMYCNYLWSSLWRHKSWKQPYQVVFLHKSALMLEKRPWLYPSLC